MLVLRLYPQQQSFLASQSSVRALEGQLSTSPPGAPQQNSPVPVHVEPPKPSGHARNWNLLSLLAGFLGRSMDMVLNVESTGLKDSPWGGIAAPHSAATSG